MCTLSWIQHDAGYQLFFNRDEKIARQQALPPRPAERSGVRFLAPVDGDFGGTWIAANEFGVSVCLLNGANLTGSSGVECAAARSRGLIIPELISAPSAGAIGDRIREMDFSPFAQFTIAGLGPGQAAVLAEWDGARKTIRFQDEHCSMLTSSSFDTEGVRASRQEEFRSLPTSGPPVSAERLAAFHASHVPVRSAYSTCMHRPDAETVSFSWIRVSGLEAEFFYSPSAPCGQASGTDLKLARRSWPGNSAAAIWGL